MKLSLKNLFTEHSNEVSIQDTLAITSFEYDSGEIFLKDGIHFSAVFKKLNNQDILLTGLFECSLTLSCSRCTEPTLYPMKGSFQKDIHPSKETFEDEDYLNGYEFDMKAFLLEEIYVLYPMKVLCSNDCKGICRSCGQNLNMKSCNCDNDDIDPRLMGLKALFYEKFKEV